MRFGELLTKTVPLSAYEDMRYRFLSIYQKALEIPEIDSAMDWDNPRLQREATTAWERALHYDPHEEVNQAVETLQELKKIIARIGDLALVLFLFFSIGAFSIIRDTMNSITAPIEGTASFVILPAGLAAVARLYIYLLATNRDVVQSLNGELRIGPSQIQSASRDRPKLFAYYVWNRGLSGSRMHTVFGFLLLIRHLSQGFYNFIFDTIENKLPVFARYESKISLFRELYSKLRPKIRTR